MGGVLQPPSRGPNTRQVPAVDREPGSAGKPACPPFLPQLNYSTETSRAHPQMLLRKRKSFANSVAGCKDLEIVKILITIWTWPFAEIFWGPIVSSSTSPTNVTRTLPYTHSSHRSTSDRIRLKADSALPFWAVALNMDRTLEAPGQFLAVLTLRLPYNPLPQKLPGDPSYCQGMSHYATRTTSTVSPVWVL